MELNFDIKKEYVIIAVVIIGSIYLFNKLDKRENYSAIQLWPHIPPKQWKPRKSTKWAPWWYYDSEYTPPDFSSAWNPRWDSENQYHPAVPRVVKYDVGSYKLPSSQQNQ